MKDTEIKFNDGTGYERYMGVWSQLAAEQFLKWISPKPNLKWLDVGCGNGAFTETIVQHCQPSSVDGIDPSEAQLSFARSRPALSKVDFHKGDAMAQPFADSTFDIAVMPLVIFFVPDPIKGVAEMTRVVRSGGTVAAYSWDLVGGGLPYFILQEAMRAMKVPVGEAPNPKAAEIEILRDNWTKNRLADIETKVMSVQRTFVDAEDFWTTVLKGPSLSPGLMAMAPDQFAILKSKMKTQLPTDTHGRITLTGRFHAIQGRVTK